MDVRVIDSVLIMSGSVVDGDLGRVQEKLNENPGIYTVVLRNSFGGDAPTGYRVGELFRERKLTTVVSGYCISSCSRMFLGGIKRVYSDDYPAHRTYVGFHGHYKDPGVLDKTEVEKLGLYDWILKYSDGKADPALVTKWINIEKSNGMVAFFHPKSVLASLGTVRMCLGTELGGILACPVVNTDALERGVATDLEYFSSPDKSALVNNLHQKYASSGYADILEISKLPLYSSAAIDNYRRYLAAPSPKAFAVFSDKRQWAWNAGDDAAADTALQRCSERANGKCTLYAVDDMVVYKP